MRIGDGDIVVLVAGELGDGQRKAIEQLTGSDTVLDHVVGATVDRSVDSDGKPNGSHTIIGLRADED